MVELGDGKSWNWEGGTLLWDGSHGLFCWHWCWGLGQNRGIPGAFCVLLLFNNMQRGWENYWQEEA